MMHMNRKRSACARGLEMAPALSKSGARPGLDFGYGGMGPARGLSAVHHMAEHTFLLHAFRIYR